MLHLRFRGSGQVFFGVLIALMVQLHGTGIARAGVAISGLPQSTGPTTNTFVEVADLGASPASRKVLVQDLISTVLSPSAQAYVQQLAGRVIIVVTNIGDAQVASGAAIARSKIAAGTASTVVVNDGSGNLSSQTVLAKVLGGAGADMSGVTFPSAGTITITTDWNTIAKIEAATGVNIITDTEISNMSQLEALVGSVNIITATEIDTSAELAAIITDETGSGALVFANSGTLNSPTLVTPTIASFVNATHTHQNAAGGGLLDAAAIGSGTLNVARLPASGVTAGTYGNGSFNVQITVNAQGQVTSITTNAVSGGGGSVYVNGVLVTNPNFAGNQFVTQSTTNVQLNPLSVITNSQRLLNAQWLGSSAGPVAIDQGATNEYVWNPSGNCSFYLTNKLTGTNLSATVHVLIWATSAITVTNTVDSWTPKGNWGALTVGWNELEIVYKSGTNFISQDTGLIPIAQIAPGSSGQFAKTVGGATAWSNLGFTRLWAELRFPDGIDGAGCTYPNTNDFTTGRTFMVPQFSGSAATNANYCRFWIAVPPDLDTTKDLTVSLTDRLSATDTGARTYHVGVVSVADGTDDSSVSASNWVVLSMAGQGSGTANKIYGLSGTTATGWRSALTANQMALVELRRDGANDASTLATALRSLRIYYTSNQ